MINNKIDLLALIDKYIREIHTYININNTKYY